MIRVAVKADAPKILQLIRDLALYEKAPQEAVATLEQVELTIFSDKPS
ncbi:MAG: GNAT family N-acetyltransferase, partial [Streptomycetaceae bacterium]